MITAGPRSSTAGAPLTYVTIKQFLVHFDQDTLRDLPDIEALQDAGLIGGEVGSKDASENHDLPLFVEDSDTS